MSSKKKLRIQTKQVIDVQDWDALVTETYKRPYSFQQQDGCKARGTFHFTVPDEVDDYKNTSIRESADNVKEMGVSFAAWLARDPNQHLSGEKENGQDQWLIDLWWDRYFYPDIQMIANDLNLKGLLPTGDYTIDIDW